MRTFEGIRVVDFTQAIAGPFATYQLALMGADVVKLEQPGIGDQGRQMYPLDKTNREAGYSAIFLSANAGKRSMTIDLKNPEAAEIVRRLVEVPMSWSRTLKLGPWISSAMVGISLGNGIRN